MNATLVKYLRAPLLGAFAALLAACTTQSGPTYTLHAVTVPNQKVPVYRVSCDGLLESSNSCVRVAEETCKENGVTLLESIDRVDAAVPKADPRELTFMCGKPAVQQPAAEPVVNQDVQPVAPQRQMVLQGEANFATDSSTLSPTAKASLDQFLSANQGIKLRRVIVTGYTDSTASAAHNQELSQERATTVAQYLRDGGLQAEQFYTQGKGSADPVASNATAEGRAQNRRVEASVRVE
ncbi:OmpA family protein [Paraburkholderia bryophila]|uniref:OmpA family protein n=1 Tax=Paraburkholderia bryophila TaxID=420952 RepID=UPI0023498D33|nr:OmpA family protein [Paraburkholderia bryophila]WCM19292.1 OmpA family protein [Paraburkholderia bryophila]